MRTRLTAALLGLPLLLGLVACDDDDDGDGEDSGPAPTLSASECAPAAEAAAAGVAGETFADSPEVAWQVLEVTELEGGQVVAELDPEPDQVGYPLVRFLFTCDEAGTPTLLAAYVPDGDTFVLLLTTDSAPDDLPETLGVD